MVLVTRHFMFLFCKLNILSSFHSGCIWLYQVKNQDPVLPIKTEIFATTVCCYLFIAGTPTTIKYLFLEITVDHLVIITATKERKRQLCSFEYIISNPLCVFCLLSQRHPHNNGGHWLLQDWFAKMPPRSDHQLVLTPIKPWGTKIRTTWVSKGRTCEMGLKS